MQSTRITEHVPGMPTHVARVPAQRPPESPTAVPPATTSTLPVPEATGRRHARHRAVAVLAAQLLVTIAACALVAALLHLPTAFAGAVVVTSLIGIRHYGGYHLHPRLRTPGDVVGSLAAPVAIVSGSLAVAGAGVEQQRDALVLVMTVAGADASTTWLRRHFHEPVRAVVIGEPEAIARTAHQWARSASGTVVGGLVPDRATNATRAVVPGPGVAMVQGLDRVRWCVQHWQADVVLVHTGPGIAGHELRRLSWQLEGSSALLAVAGALDFVAPHRIAPSTLGGSTVLRARPGRAAPAARAAKWVFDRTVGCLLLLLATPLLLVLAALVRADSPGPALFRQTRVGRNGRAFTMLKLRTMEVGADAERERLSAADEGNGRLFKIHEDPRVTRVGRLLRRTSLDELPQLLNVVRGQMSLVGPRPALPEEVARYDVDERRRLVVRPGMTGLWQVSGRSDLDWEQSVALDLHYTDNHRLVDDALIGVRTIGAVVRSRGAY